VDGRSAPQSAGRGRWRRRPWRSTACPRAWLRRRLRRRHGNLLLPGAVLPSRAPALHQRRSDWPPGWRHELLRLRREQSHRLCWSVRPGQGPVW